MSLSPKEQIDDIADVLREVAGFMNVPILESEVKAISRRLAPLYGADVFRVLRALPERNFLPSGAELEDRVRKLMGKPPLKGLAEDQIEKNKRELIAGGQDPRKAEIGAEVARRSRRKDPVVQYPPTAPEPVAIVALAPVDDLDGDLMAEISTEPENSVDSLGEF